MSTASSEIIQSGFGQGFSKEVEAILAVADRGLLYAQEIRENLQKAGMVIYEKIDLPDIEPPRIDVQDDPEQWVSDEIETTDEEYAE